MKQSTQANHKRSEPNVSPFEKNEPIVNNPSKSGRQIWNLTKLLLKILGEIIVLLMGTLFPSYIADVYAESIIFSRAKIHTAQYLFYSSRISFAYTFAAIMSAVILCATTVWLYHTIKSAWLSRKPRHSTTDHT